MQAFICTTCGTQYPPADKPPPNCPICDDERQYVPPSGQGWTTQEKLAVTHVNGWHQYEPGIIGVATQPRFAIGQRAVLMRTAHGNVLWDCISMLDDATVSLIKALGGVQAMAISHPHFYTTMNEWAEAFDVPVHVHADDREWIMRQGTAHQALGRRDAAAHARRDADPRRRPLHRLQHAALGRRRVRARHRLLLRHRLCGGGPPARDLHAQLSELRAAAGGSREGDRRCARAVRVRQDVRQFLRERDRERRQAGVQPLGRALSRGDRADVERQISAAGSPPSRCARAAAAPAPSGRTSAALRQPCRGSAP